MNHLESLIKQYYEWKGYIVRNNVKVGRLSHGGWAGELDIVAYHPVSEHLLHLEPSVDAHPWETREGRFKKKFEAGKRYIRKDVFPWLKPEIPIEQIAVLVTSSRKKLGGGAVISIDEFVKDIKTEVAKIGIMAKHAIPEQFDLLRTIQAVTCGYYKVV
jgi:hypothetical protein